MAKKKTKKVTRKQLLKEPDEFITFTAKAIRFAMDYKYQLTGGLVGLVILILVGTGIRYFSIKTENTAFTLLSQSQIKYETLLKQNGPQKAFSEVAADFERILKKYSTQKGGRLARVIYASICYKAGNLDQAIALYNESLKDFKSNPFLKNLILSGLGYAHEEKKDLESATRYFNMIVAGSDPVMKSEALYHLGRLYDAKGDRDKSIEAYKQLLDRHAGSIYTELVKEKLGG
jgi:tetratricopeptide (TPR) repeat protein